jgi:ribonuclease J
MTARRPRRRGGELVLLALGGMGEIGMNLYAYGYGPANDRRWVVVDCGVKFGDERDPGIDIILPDPAYLEAEGANLEAIVLTHAHEDHLGAVAWLWPRLRVPVYCTAFAAELLSGKLAEAGLDGEVPVHLVEIGERLTLGDFTIEFIAVTHSIPESTALAITTPAGTVVHSADLKIDRSPTIPPRFDEARFKAVGDAGVEALVCDSTNVLREGFSPSEGEVASTLATIVGSAEGRVAVTTFASHVGRIASVCAAARQSGREVVVAGRALRTVIEAARAVGLLKEAGTFLDEQAFPLLPPARTLLLCTGSQGEPRAALARIAEDNHPTITLERGDLVIFSSRTIPGNEKAVGEVINGLALQGVEVLTAEDALVHTSGHPRQEELKTFYAWLRPRLLVPMHGEARHLERQVALAREAGVAEAMRITDGQILRLAPGPAEVVDEAPAGRLHVDGRLVVPATDGPAKFRRKLAFSGIVFVSLVLDGKGLALEQRVIADGLPEVDARGTPLTQILDDAVAVAFDAIPRARRRLDDDVREVVRVAVRRTAEQVWGKRPICHVAIHRV